MTRSLKVIPFKEGAFGPRWREELLARLSLNAALADPRDRALPKPTFVTLGHEL